MRVSPKLIERFRDNVERLTGPEARLGLAVSGGPDSLALLLLATSARPGAVEAATVDHALRQGSLGEAETVAAICKDLDVPHAILTVEWPEPPRTALQERARTERYRRLGDWAQERGLDAVVTAHQLDDQAETFLMRAMRGAGVKGLAGMRPLARVPGSAVPLLRPLLGWRRDELERVCVDGGLTALADPSNADEQFERVRVRRALAEADWLDPIALARSAAHLAQADAALHWATSRLWEQTVIASESEIVCRPGNVPREILRRTASRAVTRLAREGQGLPLRGRELDQLVDSLVSGGKTTLRGVLCEGGEDWRFVPAPHRTRREPDSR